MSETNQKVRVAGLSIASNTLLILFKTAAGILSGSVSILSEAIHSAMDLVASVIAFLSVRHASRPADREHPYGHGKLENISGIAEGILIFIAAGLILYEAVRKIFEPAEIDMAWVAIGVMFVSGGVNFLVSRKLYRTAKAEDSMALEADALHLRTDVYTSLGVGAGLLLIKLTGLVVLDSIVAIAVALLILKEAWQLSKSAFDTLIDVRLSDEEEARIEEVLQGHSGEFIDFHKLKTRKSGNRRHVDFHLTMDPDKTVRETHRVIAAIKKDMNDAYPNTRVTVHVDPYRDGDGDHGWEE